MIKIPLQLRVNDKSKEYFILPTILNRTPYSKLPNYDKLIFIIVLTNERREHLHPELKDKEQDVLFTVNNPDLVFVDNGKLKDGTERKNTVNVVKLKKTKCFFITIKFSDGNDTKHSYTSIIAGRIISVKRMKSHIM